MKGARGKILFYIRKNFSITTTVSNENAKLCEVLSSSTNLYLLHSATRRMFCVYYLSLHKPVK